MQHARAVVRRRRGECYFQLKFQESGSMNGGV
jgi:hypothetical protein